MLGEHGLEGVQLRGHQRGEQIVLILKKEIQRTGGHAGGFADAAQGSALVPLGQKLGPGALQQLFFGFAFVFHAVSCIKLDNTVMLV